MANPEPDCNCRKFLDIMGMSWHECMYAVMCKKALEINQDLMEALTKNKKLKDHIDLLNKLKDEDE